jgi:roadblock/LC7 domain-containing protein
LLGVQTPIREITSDLSMLANIAAMSDNSILELTRMFAQLRTTGTASLQDLQEYSTRNIMLMQHLAKRFGNVAAAASAGQITFDDVRRALYEMSLQADSLSKLNKSLSGQFARLKNNLLVVATAIGNQVLPYATKLLNWASDMIERLGGLEDKLGFLKDLMVAVFDVAFEGIKEKWSEMLSWMIAEGKRRAVTMGKTFVEYIPGVMMARAGMKALGFGPEAAAQPVKQGGLEAATARLNDVLARLKPVAQPEVKPNLELLPAVKADVGKGVSGFFNQALEFGQGLVNKGIAWADKTFMEGAAFVNQFSGMMRETGETAQQQEARMAGAMQKGSADAYSAIIGAMMSKKDPLLTATEKQTKATVEPLINMLGIMQKGGVVGMFKEFVGAL